MKSLLLILFVTTLYLNLYSQRTETEKIADIKLWYKDVMSNIDTYEKKVIDDPDGSTEGGEITFYLTDGNAKLIKAIYYGEMGKITNNYYFRNNKLFFMFQVKEIYDAPIYVDSSGKGTKEENRFYFYSDEMIRWLDKDKKEVEKTEPAFKENEESILEEANELLDKL